MSCILHVWNWICIVTRVSGNLRYSNICTILYTESFKYCKILKISEPVFEWGGGGQEYLCCPSSDLECCSYSCITEI